MGEKYLTLAQNVCAARIFLNTFGFILENVDDVNQFSKIKIYDKTMNEVGQLCFDNGKVIMVAEKENIKLNASYDIAKIFGFVDRECNDALFGQWSSKINFQMQNDNGINLSGEFLIGNTVDSQFGISCLCHPLINCEIPGDGRFTLKMLRDGCLFGFDVISNGYIEKISIRPHDDLNGFLLHDTTIWDYSKKCFSPTYRKYAGIFGRGSDELHVFLKETYDEQELDFHDEDVAKVGEDNSSSVLIQKGLLMQKLDSSMFQRISELRELLLIGDVSLLDNLISVCYDSYNDEEIQALLGLNREKKVYQDGADNLTDSYFGIGGDSQFLSLEAQKRLLKK